MQSQLEDYCCLLSGSTLISDVTWALEDIKSFYPTSVRAHLDIYKKRHKRTQNKKTKQKCNKAWKPEHSFHLLPQN